MIDTNKNIIDNNHLTDNQMSIAADAMLSDTYDALAKDISSHIEECMICKEKLFTLVDVLKQMGADKNSENKLTVEPNNHKTLISKSIKWLAAASVLLLFMASAFYWVNTNEYKTEIALLEAKLDKASTKISDDKDNRSAEVKMNQSKYESTIQSYLDSLNELAENLKSTSKLLAVAFEKNKVYEDQMEMNLRSGMVEVKTSQYIEKPFGKKVKLEWKTENSETMSVAIFNNKGTMVLDEKNVTESFSFESDELLPGIYYWKLVGKEGVVFIGKITLN